MAIRPRTSRSGPDAAAHTRRTQPRQIAPVRCRRSSSGCSGLSRRLLLLWRRQSWPPSLTLATSPHATHASVPSSASMTARIAASWPTCTIAAVNKIRDPGVAARLPFGSFEERRVAGRERLSKESPRAVLASLHERGVGGRCRIEGMRQGNGGRPRHARHEAPQRYSTRLRHIQRRRRGQRLRHLLVVSHARARRGSPRSRGNVPTHDDG